MNDSGKNLKPGSAKLVDAIAAKTARIGIIGLGYVGLPLAWSSWLAGFEVVGFDIDPEKVTLLNKGQSPIRTIDNATLGEMLTTKRFRASSAFDEMRDMDLLLICVPTPLGKHREPDLSFIEKTAESIVPRLRSGQLVVLESSTYPGTTREVVKPILEKTGLKSGTDFWLAYSPEREDPGNEHFKSSEIPRVVGGDGPEALAAASKFYGSIVPRVIEVSSPETAEAAKLMENIFRAVNIALVNELKLVYEQMGINIWEVIDAAKSKPFGFMPFYPGPGLGGHCIPIDPFYLTWKAREFNVPTRFIELAGEVNADAPMHVVNALSRALSDRKGKGLNGARILLLGVAYKKNVEDMRESPSLVLIDRLEERGAIIAFYDPFIPVIPMTREHAHLGGRKGVDWSKTDFGRFDACLIATDHDGVDYQALLDACEIVVDTRNVTANAVRGKDRVVRA